mmetsp:Transcript_19023/g.26539  ORF Transcript_19023/g.26539 Transcript_19023/m.26539 type:complete len:302 (-) Transcript_19023:32-937(-)
MSTIHKNFRLDDRNKTVHLADLSVLSKSASVSFDSFHGRSSVRVNTKNAAPLSEASTLLVVLLSTLSKTVDSLSDGLSIHEGSANTGINLDSRDNVVSLHDVNERCSISSVLEEGLFVKDGGRDSLVHVRSAEKKLTPCTTVALLVRNTDLLKALSDGLSRLVASKDTLTISNNSLCGSTELSAVRGRILLSWKRGQRSTSGVRVWDVSLESEGFLSIRADDSTVVHAERLSLESARCHVYHWSYNRSSADSRLECRVGMALAKSNDADCSYKSNICDNRGHKAPVGGLGLSSNGLVHGGF